MNSKHPGGRPPKVTPEQKQEVLKAFELYLDREPDPTAVGFCAYDPIGKKYRITKDDINGWEEFSELRKAAISKQEAYLLYGVTQNKLNPSVSIFRLKQPQHGYTDRQNLDHTTNGNDIGPILVKFIGEDK
jgi:hypothetical protein